MLALTVVGLLAVSRKPHPSHTLAPARHEGLALDHEWDSEHDVTCFVEDAKNTEGDAAHRNYSYTTALLGEHAANDERACQGKCLAEAQCDVAVHNAHNQTCALYRDCTILVPAEGQKALLRPTRLEVPPKEEVAWKAPAALVVASFDRPLTFLEKIPDGRADVVVYQKNRKPVSFAKDHAGTNLRYYAHLPNFGRKGGGRESAVYFQFLLDFYDNLPELVIFSQDEMGQWAGALQGPTSRDSEHPSTLREESTLLSAKPLLARTNCMCSWISENFYVRPCPPPPSYSGISAPALPLTSPGG
jgi:hypothetical protein